MIKRNFGIIGDLSLLFKLQKVHISILDYFFFMAIGPSCVEANKNGEMQNNQIYLPLFTYPFQNRVIFFVNITFFFDKDFLFLCFY